MPLDPILLIPDGAVDVDFPAPQYQADFGNIVGNAATDADGFEDLFLVLSQFLGDGPNFLAGLDVSLAALDTIFPDAVPPFELDFANSLAAAITQGDPTFAQYNVHLTGNNPPPPGGGGGGSSDGCLQFDFGTVPNTNATGSAVYKHVFGLQNNTNKVVKIVKTTVTPTVLSNTFVVNPSITGKTIPVNGTLSVTVLLQLGNPPQGKIQANLAIQTDAPDPQPCIDLFANSVQGTPPGGGGGGGGGGGCGTGDLGGIPAECASPNPIGEIPAGGLKWIP